MPDSLVGEIRQHQGCPARSVEHPCFHDGMRQFDGTWRATALRESNPMMGLRGVRLSIVMPEIVEMQVRAIMEAAADCTLRGIVVKPEVMIPLTGTVKELEWIQPRLERIAAAVMSEKNVKFEYKFGTMIEIPRAAVTAAEIAGPDMAVAVTGENLMVNAAGEVDFLDERLGRFFRRGGRLERHADPGVLAGEAREPPQEQELDAVPQPSPEDRHEREPGGDAFHAPYELVLTHDNAIDVEKIVAELRDGLLRVSLPKHEAVKPRKIEMYYIGG